MAKKNSRPNLAARKSASKKAQEQKLASRKAFWKANKKQILIIGAIILAAIVVLAMAIDYFYVPTNTVRSFMGNLLNVKENALIREIDGRYYEFGTVDAPSGYAPADYGMSIVNDENETFFYFETTEEDRAINSIYTIGVKSRNAAEMIEPVSASFNYEEQTENKQVQLGGHDVHYFYSKGQNDDENPGVYIATMTCYVDTIKDSCVLVSLASVEGALDTLPTEEAMLAEAEDIFASFHITK